MLLQYGTIYLSERKQEKYDATRLFRLAAVNCFS
jgi:hypothetical protein